MAVWSDLPRPLWELIFKHLDELIDRLRFISVCPFFQSIGVEKQSYRLSSPFLLLPPPTTGDSSTRELFSLADYTAYKSYIPELQGRWCCGSSFGWLFTVDFESEEISLINPITRAQIILPPLSAFTDPPELQEEPPRNDIWFIAKATISSSPSQSNDFIVMTMITYWSLAFCKPGDDKWVNLPTIYGPCEDVRYYNGKFYVLTNWGSLITWDLSDIDGPIMTTIVEPVDDEIPFQRYLVESIRGELFKLCRIVVSTDLTDGGDENFYQTIAFDMFKLDEDGRKWVPGCLCNQAVFLGYNSAICISTLEYPEFKDHGIYFTDDNPEWYFDNPRGCNDVGLYDIEADRVWKFDEQPFWTNPCIWVTPSMR